MNEQRSKPIRRAQPETETPYYKAELGFREYWYPVCGGGEVGEKPHAVKLLGDKIVLLRRDGRVYALADCCPHRGTPLSAGSNEFPGQPTIVCGYHGWTFDVRTGSCVAVLCEGPDSGAVGKARVRTYPVEERKGIVWIWMGGNVPVPLEDDVPALLLRDETVVKVRHNVRYGNWRWHAENVAGGHAQLVHKSSIWHWFHYPVSYPTTLDPRVYEDEDGRGIITGYRYLDSPESGEFPGLGMWPAPVSPLRRAFLRLLRPRGHKAVAGITESMLRLPGVYRVVHHPMDGSIYYEWWVPVDADHYIYFQVTTFHPTNIFSRIWMGLKYYAWGLPFGAILFNNQDAGMVKYTTDYVKSADWIYLSPLTRQDEFHALWRRICNEEARDHAPRNRS